MNDDDPEDGDSGQPKGGARPPSDPKDVADRALKDLEAIQRSMKPALELEKQLKPIRAALELQELTKPLRAAQELTKPLREAQERLKPFLDIQNRMKAISDVVGESSALGRLSKQIAEQQHAIDAFKLDAAEDTPPDFTRGIPGSIGISPRELPKFPPNPIFETNSRLDRIERRFEQIHGIAADAAQIAAGLQATGVEFLQKFEKAAADTDRTAGRAIWISIGAVIVAVALTAVQIGYSEYRREPSNGAEVEATLEAVRAELAATREAAAAASTRLGEQVALSDKESAAVLREIRDLLSRPTPSPAPGPEAP